MDLVDKIVVRFYQMNIEPMMTWYTDDSNSMIENIIYKSEYKFEIWL